MPVAASQPAPNHGRAVIDVVGERASVWEVVADYPGQNHADPLEGALLRRLCVSPCVADLAVGAHRLAFTLPDERGRHRRRDTGLVYVGRGTTLYRHSFRRPPRTFTPVAIGGLVLTGISASGVGSGLFAWMLGRAFGDEETQTLGAVLLGASAGLLVTGLLMMGLGKDEGAEGMDAQWTLGVAEES